MTTTKTPAPQKKPAGGKPGSEPPKCGICGDPLGPFCTDCGPQDDADLTPAELMAALDGAVSTLTGWELADLRRLIEAEVARRGPHVCAGLR